ncbi:LOW QUALITY PROTEIN: Methyltransf_10 domain-containing protein, partial [Cephalotus follicularis]
LASLYPSFKPFVFYSRGGRPIIDWTDFNDTRELTWILLFHDHGLRWWIPDGQLCPTVPNRSNYIHWVEDLLLLDIIPKTNTNGENVRGFDIGTGANSSLLGWRFVGSDVTDVALEWAERNVKSNPHVSELIEIRKVQSIKDTHSIEESCNGGSVYSESEMDLNGNMAEEAELLPSSSFDLPCGASTGYFGPPILVGVVKDGGKFDFCMCNPPFFESMEEAGLNPKTSCGGTPEEMVCPGGEKEFITRIIDDSDILKQSFRWYTTMVGRKSNLKFLTSKLWEVGVTTVKTTEFVQGQTCRWGLAWSFVAPDREVISSQVNEMSNLSFMLQVWIDSSSFYVLQSTESFFCSSGASCKLNASAFTVDITASNDQCDTIMKNARCKYIQETSDSSSLHIPLNNICFRISIFQQIPGTLLVKGSLQHRDNPVSG